MYTDFKKKKKSAISTYLLHLYYRKELLTEDEITDYNTGLAMLQFECLDDEDPVAQESEEEEEKEEPLDWKRRKSTDPERRDKLPENMERLCQDPSVLQGSKFFTTGHEWLRLAKFYHDKLAELVLESAEVLKCDPEKLVDVMKALPSPEQLKAKDEEIRNLRRTREELVTKMNVLEGDLNQSRESLQASVKTVQAFQRWVTPSADLYAKASFYDEMKKTDTSLSNPKIVRVMVEMSSRMENSLKELRQLATTLWPNKSMDFTGFPEVPMEGILLKVPGSPSQSGRLIDPGFIPLLTKINTYTAEPSQPALEISFQTPGLQVRGNLEDRVNVLQNPARTHPDAYEHMEDVTPEKETITINLGDDEEDTESD